MNRINSFFEKVYVITRPSFLSRQDHIIDHFKKLDIKFEFFVSPDPDLFLYGKLSKSEQSLLYGHYYCVTNSLLNKYKNILICEDDVFFTENIHSEFDNFIKNVPNDWHFLQLGNLSWATQWLSRVKINNNLYKFLWGTGSHCVGINNTAYEKVIATFEYNVFPTDKFYYMIYMHSNCYCPDKFLAEGLSKTDYVQSNTSYQLFDSTIDHVS